LEPNPYAAPQAPLETTVIRTDQAPPLWNPNAAALWSLLLSPIFGAILHMYNWRALGEPAKAAQSKMWAIVSAVVLTVIAIGGEYIPGRAADAISRGLGLALLLTWFFQSGRPQVQWVRGRYGSSYPRKGWGKPLLIAIAVFVGFVVVVGGLMFAFDMSFPDSQ
jgi:hypothetical protein